jgi:diguanylate cyclase (GGDEF)-like protein
MDGMAQLIRQADYNRPNAAVLYIDLNNFQEVNDAFGYLVGDSLLKAIAARLMGIRRKNDVLGRLSGDDFIILAKDMGINDGDLDALISSIHSCFDQPFDALGHEVHVIANIGAVVLTDPRITTEKLLRNAEKVMSKVKSGQLRRSYIAEIDMLQELDTRRGMDSKFRKAFLGNRLTLYYQPLVELESSRTCGAEALLRIIEFCNRRGRGRGAERGRLSHDTRLQICSRISLWKGNADEGPAHLHESKCRPASIHCPGMSQAWHTWIRIGL